MRWTCSTARYAHESVQRRLESQRRRHRAALQVARQDQHRVVRQARGDAVRIWPFETGFKALGEADLEGVDVVAAEVYPSMLNGAPLAGEVKDQTQVRTLAEHFARLDEAGKLGEVFGPPKGTAADVVLDAEQEEGWILGA